MLALLLSVVTAFSASAATVTPTVSNLSFTDADGNPVTLVTNNVPYKITFDFSVPDGTEPGDTFTVQLSDGFTVAGTAPVGLGTIAVAEGAGSSVTVTFTDGVTGLQNVEGGFEYLVNYTEKPAEGTLIKPGITIGTKSEYVPVEYPYGPVPGPPPMEVNKWSGYSTAPTNANTAKSLKLQSPAYNYQWIAPAEGQVFAHWFIELNNWQGGGDPQVIGQDIVITDTMQGLGNFT